jgi:aminotransferase in exopolysaccharide biosynthesis
MSSKLIKFVREIYKTEDFISLHEPKFEGNEVAYVTEAINSTFVSSVGKFVDQFESSIEAYTGSKKAVAAVNGTAALHAAFFSAGVSRGDVVITQPLTFVATCNALHHMGAEPAFVDICEKTLSLCPKALEIFLTDFASIDDHGAFLVKSGKRIKAVVPMHTFGHPARLDELLEICKRWNLYLIEDAAESLGSFYKQRHTGTIGDYGILSFNGNKVITTGGGGMVLCSSAETGNKVKHITTTAKVPHAYEFFHDEAGFNYRMPNINAALGCAQMESLSDYLFKKRKLAMMYKEFFRDGEYVFVDEPKDTKSNFWLNTIICPNKESRDYLLRQTNDAGVMTRPVWTLMYKLPMYKDCIKGNLKIAEWAEKRLINLPSSPAEI